MTPLLEELLRTRTVQTPGGKSLPLHSAISVPEGELLQRLILEARPKVSLEIGMAYGISSLFICEALAKVGGVRHIVRDPNQDVHWSGVGMSNLRNAGFGNLVELRYEESQKLLPRLAYDGLKIDFAFIDGWHTFDHTLVDFFYIDKMLNVGGLVVFDDTQLAGIRAVCRFIATNRSYEVCGFVEGPTEDRQRTKMAVTRLFHRFARRSKIVRYVIHPKFSWSDESLGFSWNPRAIAFKKLSEDTRNWNYHSAF